MLTDEMKRKIEAEIETCPNKKCACIDAMQVVQSIGDGSQTIV